MQLAEVSVVLVPSQAILVLLLKLYERLSGNLGKELNCCMMHETPQFLKISPTF